MRTFVFISEIPPFLLEPLAIASHGSSSGKPQRDPTYERLRRLLVDHSSGVMVVMHLGSRGYGLALYASKEEALAACQTTIQPDSQNGATYPPLRLRIVERETAPPPEAVYSPTILIEGESVLKSELADTRGLEGTYRGQCVPRWCPKTVEKVDCPFGTNCNRIHRLAYQRTVRKLPRTDEEEWAGALHHLSPEEREVVNRITHSHREAQEHVVPTELRLQPSVYVPVTREEARTLVCGRGKPEYESLLQGLTKRVESACAEANLKPDSLFMQLTIPGGAPWDWGLGDSTPGGGLSRLRERCTLPANGAPTPLERDIFAQRLFHAVNHINRFPAAETGLRAFGWSQRVGRALEAYLERDGGKEELFICVQPWLYLPTVGCEATLFLERGGRRLRGLVQRYGELRLMTSASYLHKATQEKEAVNRALDHFAVLGSHADTPAEEGLEQDMQLFARPLRTAALSLRRHLAGRRTTGASSSPSVALPAGASWCAHLAVVLPVPVDGVVNLDPSTPPTVVVKSVSPYKEGVENCALYSQVNMRQMQGDDSSSASAEVEMVWNTHKHLYASLFPREVMTKFASSTV